MDGVERYRHLNDKALIGEIVRRGIVGSRADIDLQALALQWRPHVLRSVLAFHDRYPKGLWLPGGIRAAHLNRSGEVQTLALYRKGERQIIINADVYSKREVKRAQWRGNVDGVQNSLAGSVFHECWHCVQDAYTPSMKAFIGDMLVRATGDERMRYPLAHRELRREIIDSVRDYAVTKPIELEAELIRAHAQGAPTRMSHGLVLAADALFGPAAASSSVERVQAEWAQSGPPELSFVGAPFVLIDARRVGRVHGTASSLIQGIDDQYVRYIETEDGHLYRLAGTTLVDATASFDAHELVSYEVPDELGSALCLNVGEPMWFRNQWSDAALPDGFAASPVAQVLEVHSVLTTASDFQINLADGRRTDVVRRTEQLLAATDPSSIGSSFGVSGISPVLAQSAWVPAEQEFLRCRDVAEVDRTSLIRAPFGAHAVLITSSGDQVLLQFSRSSSQCIVSCATAGGEYGFVEIDATTLSELRVGGQFDGVVRYGQTLGSGTIDRIIEVEQSPVNFSYLQQVQPHALRSPTTLEPPSIQLAR